MRLLVTGSSGFIGTAVCSFFEQKGDTVVRLSRKNLPNSLPWDPETGEHIPGSFEDFDAVIHLAGEPIFGRWTKAKKRKILFSRTVSTLLLSQILAATLRPPKVFISASAVGYYGNRGEEILTEESEAGQGFLAAVTCEWEKASKSLVDRGTRVVNARFGNVIGPGGGILQKMLLPYRLCLGGKLGDGQQWISWIARNDLIRALHFLVHHSELEGPVNLVSPYPIRQEAFAKELAAAVHRPAFFRIPAPILKLVLGQLAEETILCSARVRPEKLLQAGFAFEHPLLKDALLETVHNLLASLP